MYTNTNLMPLNSKEHIEKLSEPGVFEDRVIGWIREYRNGVLTKEDVLNVTKKVADHRGDPSLVEKIMSQLG